MKEKIVEFLKAHKVKIMIAGCVIVGMISFFLIGFIQGCRCGGQ